MSSFLALTAWSAEIVWALKSRAEHSRQATFALLKVGQSFRNEE